MSRTLIVGGGLAGFAAALSATRRGADVTLVAAGPGATALYAGGMEICGGGLQTLGQWHPFSRLGADSMTLSGLLDEVCAELAAQLERAGHRIVGDWRRPGSYADLHGQARPAAYVPASAAGGELGALKGLRVGVVGIEAVSDYDSESTAQALRQLSGVDASSIELSTGELPPAAALTDLFGHQAPLPAAGHFDRLAYPPGLVGLPVNGFELLSAIPSPHGWRLQEALTSALADAGVRIQRARITGFECAQGTVRAALIGETRIEADAFVLAGGRFIGGGLVKNRLVREPLLDLPVFSSGRRLEEVYWPRVRFEEYLGPEPAFACGLMTDDRLRPLDADGRPAFANLRAAGAILGGYDYGAGFGFGVPLLTGWQAGAWSA